MINKHDWIEEIIEKTEQDLYNGQMPSHNKNRFREMLSREHDFWERFDKDHINGYDDGEPQTSVDFNHTDED